MQFLTNLKNSCLIQAPVGKFELFGGLKGQSFEDASLEQPQKTQNSTLENKKEVNLNELKGQ